jgi:hypothetical protein
MITILKIEIELLKYIELEYNCDYNVFRSNNVLEGAPVYEREIKPLISVTLQLVLFVRTIQ